MERSAYFQEQLAGKARVFGVNNQSPLDIAHQVRGEDPYLDMYNDPPFVHELLAACAEAFIAMARAFKRVLGEEDNESWDGACYRTGCGAAAADDTATALSPHLFAEFALPYDQRVFAPFAGGQVHFCGKAQHIIDGYLQAEEVRAINLGQPMLYDQPETAARMRDAGKVYLGAWPTEKGESLDAYLLRVLGPKGQPHRRQILSLRGHEFGIPPEHIADRWYAHQQQ